VPAFYKHALGDYRHILRLRPGDAEARERADTIAKIYTSLGRPVPTNGEPKPGEEPLVELFRVAPRPLPIGPGKSYSEDGPTLSERVAYVYEFDASAGQRLGLRLKSKKKGAGVVFDLFAREAGGTRALLTGASDENYLLPAAGKYLIRVYAKGGSAAYAMSAVVD
jgi:hypothetical protein